MLGAKLGIAVHGVAAVRIAVHRPAGGHAAQVQQERFIDEFDASDRALTTGLPGIIRRAEPASPPAELLVVVAEFVEQVKVPMLVAAIDDVAAAADAVVEEHSSTESHAAFIADADVE